MMSGRITEVEVKILINGNIDEVYIFQLIVRWVLTFCACATLAGLWDQFERNTAESVTGVWLSLTIIAPTSTIVLDSGTGWIIDYKNLLYPDIVDTFSEVGSWCLPCLLLSIAPSLYSLPAIVSLLRDGGCSTSLVSLRRSSSVV